MGRRPELPLLSALLAGLLVVSPALADDAPSAPEAVPPAPAVPTAAPEPEPQAVPAPASPVVVPPVPTPPVPAAAAPGDDFAFDLHGYYRARFVALWNAPVARLDRNGLLAITPHTGRDDAADGTYFTQRLRLEPSIRFGSDPAGKAPPKAAIFSQFDLFDTVVWGDNERRADVPLFAGNPTRTGLDGEVRPDVLLRRLWLELALPVGLLRIGRQASHGGMGLLFNDGNGFRNDFGDADFGTSFDRLLFATRPLTVFNALTKGDRTETPLVWILGYDRLVQDPLGFGSDPNASETRAERGPAGWLTQATCGDASDPTGTAPTRKCDASVGQFVTGLIWRDTKPNFRRDTDELTLGAIYVNRGQSFTESQLHILDAFWRLQLSLGATGPSLLTEGEFATIRGSTRGIKLLPGGLFNEQTGLSDTALEGAIVNAAGRIGVTDRTWDTLVEIGHSSGDEQLVGDPVFKMYPMHADHRVGLLMYPLVLHARSFNTNAGRASGALHGNGGVFNSTYASVKGRYRLPAASHQVEFVGQGLFATADTLNGGRVLGFTADYYAPRDPNDPWANNRCALIDPACALGVEFDLAVRVKWLPVEELAGIGPNDRYRIHWTTEAGVLLAGPALAPRLAEGASTVWTVQSRIAVVW